MFKSVNIALICEPFWIHKRESGVAKWTRSVVSSNTLKGSRCFFQEESITLLLGAGLFQESI